MVSQYFGILCKSTKAGFKEFIIALGYKSNIVKQYFLNYHLMSSDFEVNLSNGNLEIFNKVNSDVKVKLIETGLDTKTGGRIKKLKKYISDETFFLTYGDGLSDIDINKLLEFHKSKNKLITMTVVRPPARFGVLDIEDNGLIKSFKEKPQLQKGWINGGFFVVEPKFLDFCLSDQEMLEKEPIQRALSIKELVAYKYSGFWKCMDNLRDKKDFEKR